MDWIKKHYDQFALGVFALALLGFSGFIAMKTFSFNEAFAALNTVPQRNDKLPPLDLAPVAEAHQKLAKPPSWAVASNNSSLFVSARYILDPASGKLNRPGKGMLHPPIPDEWFLKYSLDLLSQTANQDDPDKDGFSNVDEYLNGTALGTDGAPVSTPLSTSPVDAKDHPAYYTKLVLEKWIKIPFLILFQSFDGDPQKPETLEFQINPISLRQPTQFLKIGDPIAKTKFKVEKFEFKTALNKKTEVETDVSELTLRNTETNDTVVLVITKPGNSPDSFALFSYNWVQPPQKIQVKKIQEFVLKPNIQEKFKLLDITDDHAVIALPNGEKYSVPSQDPSRSSNSPASPRPTSPPPQKL